MSEVESLIAQAERDVAMHDWAGACTRLEQVGLDSLPPYGLTLLGRAAWWVGRFDLSVAAWQRAFKGWSEADDRERAAEASIEIAEAYVHRLQPNVGQAWFRRAESLLTEEPDSATKAWLYRMKAQQVSSIDEKEVLTRTALDMAERLSDRDLIAICRHDLGRIMVLRGDTTPGLALMEEVMADVLAGAIGPRATGRIYCNMLDACGQLADYRRASEWDAAARSWCSQLTEDSAFPGICRVRRAEIKRVAGELAAAEAEAQRAIRDLSAFLDFGAQAWIEIGEVRVRQGDLEGALEAFSHARSSGADPQPGLAMVEFERGRGGEARAMLERGLAGRDTPLERAPLLPALAEVLAAQGDGEALAKLSDELTEIAARYPSTALSASAATAAGLTALTQGDSEAAVASLQGAIRLWSETRAPYEQGKVHLYLARAFEAAGQPGMAELERKAAAGLFAQIGAAQPGHRRTEGPEVGLLYTDIVRSTDLIAAIGDDSWTHLLRWHDLTLRQLFTSFGGVERGHPGDGFLITFVNPASALDCAVAIQQRLDQQRREHGFAPDVRIGLHRGRVDLVGDTLTGGAVHACARIGALAGPNEILASAAFVASTPSSRYGELRPVALRGLTEGMELTEVAWAS